MNNVMGRVQLQNYRGKLSSFMLLFYYWINIFESFFFLDKYLFVSCFLALKGNNQYFKKLCFNHFQVYFSLN